MIAALKQKEPHLYTLNYQNTVLGYALVTNLSHESLSLFESNQNLLLSKQRIIEIKNFGLFPEVLGQRHGNYFLAKLFERLFESCDIIYLSSRSTNHQKVILFYERMGMTVFHKEILENDFLDFYFNQNNTIGNGK